MSKKSQHFDVIIIGGGASGMLAGIFAAQNGAKVLILEKNKNLGEKLKITGGGRCNITNAEYDTRKLLANYGDGAPFLHSAFSQFGVKDTFEFFESNGLPLVVQERKRAFPASERALDVFRTLEKLLIKYDVSIYTDCQVTAIEPTKDGQVHSILTKKGTYTAEKYILATGGQSHPETGSTGDGFKWLARLGHSVTPPTPSIVPLAVSDEWIKSLSGVSLSFMRITFYVNGVKSFKKLGKILFTHFGLSGPLILNSAKKVENLLHEGAVTATIDAYPDTDLGALEDKLIKAFDTNKNKMLKNMFDQVTPEGTSEAILSLCHGIDIDKKVHSITKEERKQIANLLKALPVTITGLMGFDRAVVADGGVPMTEIDTKTMQSKIVKNLYVTGDLLHINRPSGGFSLQLCWTTGYVAGVASAKAAKEKTDEEK
ncbi:MAG: NAD(P)/FAD-dependent oxidoreductase [bacterium]